MKRPRRETEADGLRVLSARQRTYLLTGHDWWFLEPAGTNIPEKPFMSEEAERAGWFAHRDELLADWTQDSVEWATRNRPGFDNPEPGGPGTRPSGWWTHEAPEPRRQLAGSTAGQARYYFGMATPWSYEDGAPEFESEAEYLKRLKLLTKEERTALKGQDYSDIGCLET